MQTKARREVDSDRGKPERLEKALKMNKPLMDLYYLKDDFSALWKQNCYDEAFARLAAWLVCAESFNIAALTTFCKNIRRHVPGILGYYEFPVSSGPLEGINNKIKTLKRIAYGYHNMEILKLKILAIHKITYKLVG